MRKNSITLRIISLLVISAMLVLGLASCSDKEIYIKTFPSIKDIEYNAADYLKIPQLSEISLRKSEIDDKVEYALKSVLLENAEYTLYAENDSTEVALYDVVNITYIGLPVDENVKLSDNVLAELTNVSMSNGSELVVGSGKFVGEYFGEDETKKAEGFEDQLVGTLVGGTKNITVTYPDNYDTASLRGVVVQFTVTVNSLRRPQIGELTDEICLENTGFETVSAYREYLEEYYMGTAAYDAVLEKCEIIGHCEEMIEIYIDKYIHDKILDAYENRMFTEKEYKKIYDDFYSKMYDEAHAWACDMSDQRVINDYLFECCETTLDEEEFKLMLEADWAENGDDYLSEYGITKKSELIEYFGRDELEIVYKYEKMLKVLPEKLTII